jgi:hypothetical protein
MLGDVPEDRLRQRQAKLLRRELDSQLERPPEVAFNVEFSKRARDGGRQNLAAPHQAYRRDTDGLIRFGGVKNLPYHGHLARIGLRLYSHVNSIVTGAIEQLAQSSPGRPDAGRQRVPRAVKQQFRDGERRAASPARSMKGKRALYGADHAIGRLVAMLVPGNVLNALPQAQNLGAFGATVVFEMALHFSSFLLSNHLPGEIRPLVQRIVFHRVPPENMSSSRPIQGLRRHFPCSTHKGVPTAKKYR